MNKIEYLLSIPDVISVKEAAPIVAPYFVRASKKDKAKPMGDLTKYLCFHKDLRFGVYKHDEKFFLVRITKPKKWLGIESNTVLMELTEILTDDTEDSHLEKGSITGGTLIGKKKTTSEKYFLDQIVNFDSNALDDEAAKLTVSIMSSSDTLDESDVFSESSNEVDIFSESTNEVDISKSEVEIDEGKVVTPKNSEELSNKVIETNKKEDDEDDLFKNLWKS